MSESNIYCKNCKGYYFEVTIANSHVCITRNTIGRNPIGRRVVKGGSVICEAANQNNDCDTYERKWWKFWVPIATKDDQ